MGSYRHGRYLVGHGGRGPGDSRFFLAKHVRPAPLKQHHNWVFFTLKNHTPFWVTVKNILSFKILTSFLSSFFFYVELSDLRLLIRYEKSTLSLRFPDAHAYALKLPSGPWGELRRVFFLKQAICNGVRDWPFGYLCVCGGSRGVLKNNMASKIVGKKYSGPIWWKWFHFIWYLQMLLASPRPPFPHIYFLKP